MEVELIAKPFFIWVSNVFVTKTAAFGDRFPTLIGAH